jgi:hypothetical protein
MSTPTQTPSLTRAEAAYAHLASFRRGDVADVTGRGWFQPGVVITAQRDVEDDITRSYLAVEGCGAVTIVTVALMLSGRFTITSRDAELGRTRYFDEARYAAQNEG